MRIQTDDARVKNDIGGAMTDISFLLIIFFLVTAVFVSEEGLFTTLPEDDTSPQEESVNNVLQLYLIDYNTLKVNNRTFTNREEALAFIEDLYKNNPKLVAFFAVGKNITYQTVVELISSIKSIGIASFTMVSGTDEDFDSKFFPLEIPDSIAETGEGDTG